MRTRLVFNARNTLYGSGGTARWSREVLKILRASHEFEVRIVEPNFTIFRSGLGAYFWEQVILPFKIKKGEVLFSPSNLGSIFCKSQVVVIHDVLPLSRGGDFSRWYQIALGIIYKPLFMRVQRVFAVSHDVSNQVIAAYPFVREKIFVIGGGITQTLTLPISDCAIEARYCLIIGGHIVRKNVSFLMEFWEEVFLKTGCKLISVSRTEKNKTLSLQQSVDSQDTEWYITVFDIDDETLSRYYRDAQFVLQPSTGEGFGLPILEGMNMGTPFISTDVGVATELVAGVSRVFPLVPSIWSNYLISEIHTSKNPHELETQRSVSALRTWNKVVEEITTSFRQ